jgi:hypothetical protein
MAIYLWRMRCDVDSSRSRPIKAIDQLIDNQPDQTSANVAIHHRT